MLVMHVGICNSLELWFWVSTELCCATGLFVFFPDLAKAVAGRPVSYAAVLRMKADSSSSSALNSRMRLRNSQGVGSSSQDWPPFSRHRFSALSSQEDYMSEGEQWITQSRVKSFTLNTYRFTVSLIVVAVTQRNDFCLHFLPTLEVWPLSVWLKY